MDNLEGLRTWIELNTENIKRNYQTFRSFIAPETKLMAVVKSNAYGHGLVDFSIEIEKNGADWLGVDSIVEGLRLREEGIKIPILVLGYTLPQRVKEACESNLSITVSHMQSLEKILEVDMRQKVKVHIKVDTGLHRQGFDYSEAENLVKFLIDHKDKFEVEGLYTHFAKGKNPKDTAYTNRQIEIFNFWRDEFHKAGMKPLVHACATAGVFMHPEAHFDMVRVGTGLYGLWPSKEVRQAFENNVKLYTVLSWRTVVSEVKNVSAGAGIGYELSEALTKDSVIAICPVGYWHGYDRSLSSVGEVIIQGKRAKIIGRVSMDMITVDITHIPNVSVGAKVTLIGEDSGEKVLVEEIAEKSKTLPHEFLTRINPLIYKKLT